MFIISKEETSIIGILKLTTKVITVIMAMLIIMLIITMIIYKPVYKVSLGDKNIGFIENKENFVKQLDEYLNQSDEKIAYVYIDEKPSYQTVLLKRNNKVNDDEIMELVKADTIIYNRVYTVNTTEDELATFETKEEAQKFIDELSAQNVKDDVNFVINEAHVVSPQISSYEEAMKNAKAKYVFITTSTYDATSRIRVAETNYVNTDVVFASPAKGLITSRYGYRSSDFHTGIDIASPVGSPVYAAAEGVVIFAGSRGTYGNTVIIQHADNMITYYAHCDKLLVSEGDVVDLGTQVATIGLTGRTTGAHVHFEVRINNETVNPQIYVNNIGE